MNTIKLSRLKPNKNNPRQIRGEKLEQLKQSVGSFQKMMELRPIVVDENFRILGGNMRYAAIKALGLNEVPDSWIRVAGNLTEDEKREFVIKDNVSGGDWDWDALANEWSDLPLTDWGLDLPGFEAVEEAGTSDAEETGVNYQTQFGVIVICDNESQQKGVFEELTAKGMSCKIVVT